MEGAGEVLLDAHHRAAVVELPAVVGRREHGDQLLLREELIAVLDHLVSPADQIQLVLLQEGTHDLLPEDVAHPPLGLAPHLHAPLRVSPEQVAEQPGVGDVGGPHDGVDLLDGGEFGRESAVHAENAVLDEGGDGHAVEAVDEALPEFDVVPTFA